MAKELSSVRRKETHDRQLQTAQRAFQDKRYEDALRGYAVAYAFAPQPETLLGLAKSAHKAEHYAESQVFYQRLLEEQPGLSNRAEVDAALKLLGALLADEEVDVPQMARERLTDAKRDFQAQKYEAAIQAYAIAYALKRLPRLLFNIAQAERRWRRMVEAYLMYERLLQEEPNTPVRSEAEGYLTELRAVVTKPPLHKQAWFWTVTGSVLVAATTIGLGVGLSRRDSSSDGGTLSFDFPLLLLP